MNDFDDLFEEIDSSDEQEEIEEKQKPEPRRASRPVKRAVKEQTQAKPKTGSALKIIVGVGAGIIILIVALLVMVMLFSGNGSSKTKGVQTAETIKGHASVLEDLDSIKDSQIDALNGKLSALQEMSKTTTDIAKGYTAVTAQSTADLAVIDPVLVKLYALPPGADKGAIEITRADIAKSMTADAGATVAYEAVNGVTPAKMLEQPGKKSAPSTLSPIAYGLNYTTYIVISPFTTDKGTTHVATLVTAVGQNKDRKIGYLQFIGVLTDSSVGMFEKTLAAASKAANIAETSKPGQAVPAPATPATPPAAPAPATAPKNP